MPHQAVRAMCIAYGSRSYRVHAIAEYSTEDAAAFAWFRYGDHARIQRILNEDGEPPRANS